MSTWYPCLMPFMPIQAHSGKSLPWKRFSLNIFFFDKFSGFCYCEADTFWGWYTCRYKSDKSCLESPETTAGGCKNPDEYLVSDTCKHPRKIESLLTQTIIIVLDSISSTVPDTAINGWLGSHRVGKMPPAKQQQRETWEFLQVIFVIEGPTFPLDTPMAAIMHKSPFRFERFHHNGPLGVRI
jgi:hypothetical protein